MILLHILQCIDPLGRRRLHIPLGACQRREFSEGGGDLWKRCAVVFARAVSGEESLHCHQQCEGAVDRALRQSLVCLRVESFLDQLAVSARCTLSCRGMRHYGPGGGSHALCRGGRPWPYPASMRSIKDSGGSEASAGGAVGWTQADAPMRCGGLWAGWLRCGWLQRGAEKAKPRRSLLQRGFCAQDRNRTCTPCGTRT